VRFRAIPANELDDQLPIRRLDPGEKCDVRRIRAEGVDVLEFDTLGSCTGLCGVLIEPCRVREKARVGFRGSANRDIRILPDPAVVLIQRGDSETQRCKDSCEMIDMGFFVSSSFPNPLDIGESLNNELVGVDDAEYRQVGTAASKDERRAGTLFKDGFWLRAISVEVKNARNHKPYSKQGTLEQNTMPESKDRVPLHRTHACTR